MVDALCKELTSRCNEVQEDIQTIYFGGGTPSLLSDSELAKIFKTLEKNYSLASNIEITLEANPDDLSKQKIEQLTLTPVNRLSIGIQSFRNEDLRFMNRAHNAQEADRSVKLAQDLGIENITIDLIYAIPGLDFMAWETNIQKAIDLQVPHISSYCMTIEPKTVFGSRASKGTLIPSEDEEALRQYSLLSEKLKSSNFSHYEVSNFAKSGFESRHNTSYWNGIPYLGVGPSAHSFDGQKMRKWNVSNNALYLKKIIENEVCFEVEHLTLHERYNETVMTGFRTAKGIKLDSISHIFGIEVKKQFASEIEQYKNVGWMIEEENVLRLTEQGFFRGDSISSDFFIIEN